jgi:hypothetical protein
MELLKRMTGEELLVARINSGKAAGLAISRELDHRAHAGPSERIGRRIDWTSRIFAVRHSARLQPAA